jgi:nucleoside phosphorylase
MDDIHEPLPTYADDSNTYLLGNVKEHNIAIACLPANQYGTVNAAIVMSNMKRTFTAIRICLLVGIGGGVPDSIDLRLGDIVVGTKVVQTDLGKFGRDGRLERTATPKVLHQSLGIAVSTLRAGHELVSSRIPSILQQSFKADEYSRPGSEDRLFYADYCHILSTVSCDSCDDSKLVRRSPRTSKAPIIHYGAIASGDQVIKDSAVRDKVARELNVICFEMEAAGLMDILPCLPIRGICDYSDSHKSKEWQRYAAATAAAYAREFLEEFPITEVYEENPLGSHSGKQACESWIEFRSSLTYYCC